MKLKDEVAIVVGSGRGIGRAIALRLAKEGSNVVIADVKEDLAEKTAEEIKSIGTKSLAVKVDVRSNDDIENMVQKTLENFGRIDILVNAAGVLTLAKVVDMTEEEWDFVMDVNAKGTFLCCRAIAKQMIRQGGGGKIINIISTNGKSGWPYEAHYTASKHAALGLTRCLALELAPYKINVNGICPGYTVTDMHEFEAASWAKLMGKTVEQVKAESLAAVPLGRFGVPDDIAKVVVFLASEDSDYITAQAINVCGGVEQH
jgi:NAD(P)-dependent dehydrogenase (short-subunit alcohol dehydrogenase family)